MSKVPQQLKAGEQLTQIPRKINQICTYLQENQIIPGKNISRRQTAGGVVIDAKGGISVGGSSSGSSSHPFKLSKTYTDDEQPVLLMQAGIIDLKIQSITQGLTGEEGLMPEGTLSGDYTVYACVYYYSSNVRTTWYDTSYMLVHHVVILPDDVYIASTAGVYVLPVGKLTVSDGDFQITQQIATDNIFEDWSRDLLSLAPALLIQLDSKTWQHHADVSEPIGIAFTGCKWSWAGAHGILGSYGTHIGESFHWTKHGRKISFPFSSAGTAYCCLVSTPGSCTISGSQSPVQLQFDILAQHYVSNVYIDVARLSKPTSVQYCATYDCDSLWGGGAVQDSVGTLISNANGYYNGDNILYEIASGSGITSGDVSGIVSGMLSGLLSGLTGYVLDVNSNEFVSGLLYFVQTQGLSGKTQTLAINEAGHTDDMYNVFITKYDQDTGYTDTHYHLATMADASPDDPGQGYTGGTEYNDLIMISHASLYDTDRRRQLARHQG